VKPIQDKWEQIVNSFIDDYEWLLSEPAFQDILGVRGIILRTALTQRNTKQVLLLSYRLVQRCCTERDIDPVQLQSILEEMQHRLRVPCLEIKHLSYAEQWHDFGPRAQKLFLKQDGARAELCIKELEAGEYMLSNMNIDWPWQQ
jgi:hypothetical protein